MVSWLYLYKRSGEFAVGGGLGPGNLRWSVNFYSANFDGEGERRFQGE